MINIYANTGLLLIFIYLLVRIAMVSGIHGYAFLSSFIVFFYSMCLFFDYVLFDIQSLYLVNLDAELDVFDDDYLYINFLYIMFLISFISISIKLKKSEHTISAMGDNDYLIVKKSWLNYNSLVIFIILSLLLFIAETHGIGRTEIKSSATATMAIYKQTVISLVCIFLLSKKDIIHYDKLILSLFAIYSFTSFERENVLILFLIVFYLYGVNKNPTGAQHINYFRSALIFSSMLLSLFIYKAIVTLYNSSELGTAGVSILTDQLSAFSLTRIDPAGTLLLLKQYFIEDIYEAYYFSYIINTWQQFLSFIGIGDHLSLGRYATNYYNGGKMGTGFSMILESMLNFSYLGPIIAGGLTAFSFHKLHYRLRYFGLASELLVAFIMVKLIRTELAVLLKLYIIPILIAMFIIHSVFAVIRINKP